MKAPGALKLTDVPEVKGVMLVAGAHPLPSESIPREVVIPVLEPMLNVGVLLPSRFTVNAAIVEDPDIQLAISVPVPAVGVF